MSATVTPPAILDKFDDLAPMSGDNLTRLTYGLLDIRKPAGQLWERVAEASERTFHNVWRGGMTRGPRVCPARTDWILGRHVCPVHASNGIIRAGVRVK